MRRWSLGVLAWWAALAATPTLAHADAFDAGHKRISLFVGAAAGEAQTYLVAGAGLGVFVTRGLELSVEADHWLFGEPPVTRVSPGAKYVLTTTPSLKPYIGAFARRWFIGDAVDDVWTAGARGGVVWAESEDGYLLGGVVYESVLTACTLECSYVYPEIAIAFAF